MMARKIFVWICLGVFYTANPVTASSIPGMTPVDYCKANETSENCKSEIELYVSQLTSRNPLIVREYNEFDFCTTNESYIPSEYINGTPFGKHILPSPYKLEFLKDVKCGTVCQKVYSGSDNETINRLEFLKQGLALGYRHHWIVDNMPVMWYYETGEWSHCSLGFPIGCFTAKEDTICKLFDEYHKQDTYYLFNHVDLLIRYSRHKEESNTTFKENGGRIIFVTANLRSINHGSNPDCESEVPLEISNTKLPPDQQLSVTYTYSVKFVERSKLKWSSRYNYVSQSTVSVRLVNTHTDPLPSVNSLIIVLFLSIVVAVIMRRTLPITRYKQMELEEDPQMESGWRVIRNDVFRPPRNGPLLSAFLGSGATMFVISFITLVLVSIGMISATRQRELLFCAMLSYACLSSVAGYVSAVIYKSFFGTKYKWNMVLTSVFTSSIVFALFVTNSITLWVTNIVNAQTLTTNIAGDGMWLGVCVSMTFTGAYFGFRRKPLEYPVATNQVPRQIPKQKFYKHPLPYIIMGGVLPFGCMFAYKFLPLNCLSSIEVSTSFRFLLMFLVLVITCSETAILFCYFHLCAENYHWWWRSFLTSSSTAFYFLIYNLSKLIHPRENSPLFLDFVSYCTAAFIFFLFTGSIGFFACFWFVRKIYSLEKDRTSSLSTNNDVPNPKQLRDMPYARFDLCEEASTSQEKEESTKKHPNTADTKR